MLKNIVLCEQKDTPNNIKNLFRVYFSNESKIKVIEIVNKIRKIMGKEKLEPKILNLSLKEIPAQSLSVEKAHRILDWHPRYDLTKGLSETIKWYENYFGVKNTNE